MFWLKNSAGQKDAIFTIAIASWALVAFCIFFPMFEGFRIIGTGYIIPEIVRPTTELLTFFLSTCFLTYAYRRNKKDDIAARLEQTQPTNIAESFEAGSDYNYESMARARKLAGLDE